MSGQRPQFANKPRKKNILNDWRQALPSSDEPVAGSKYPAQLMWEQKNNGAIVMKISDGVYQENAKGNHKEIEMVAGDRNALFEAMKDACSDPNFGSKQIAVRKKQFVFTGGQSRMSDQPVVQGYLTISRTDRGIILGYTKGDYKVQIRFKGANDTTCYTKNEAGERAEDPGLMSRWYTRGYINFHQPILNDMEEKGWEPPKPKNGGNGGNGGGNNWSGGGNGNGGGQRQQQQPPADFDDDIPF